MLAPPSLQQRSRELLIGRDILRLVVRSPTLRSLPRGDGGPVLLVPGFGATDASLLPLRRLLTSLGHDARPIRLGRMGDDIRALADRTIARAIDVHDETGRRPALVGWSIGGVVSREAARDRPDMIRRVVTFGSPTVGGPSYTALAGRYKPAELAAIRAEIDDQPNPYRRARDGDLEPERRRCFARSVHRPGDARGRKPPSNEHPHRPRR